ncbi:MAG: 23S rRNA (pseudouridine(1915)-N(3))-methyltransferase RlmH [Sphingobacteriia bacterium]|nr:23S rRNA (pseudouridine(1915)-N(3))-methyltransferase RlmH [Sphingobacteriia bacterium]
MRILFVSVGKAHEAYVRTGIEDFSKRIQKYFPADWLMIAPPKNAASLSEKDLKKAEAVSIENALQKDDFFILLDEKGKLFSSVQLAQFIQQRANESCKRIVFVIGGAFGTDESIYKKANLVWSLSPLVFPHMLVRLILAEQVYRACTIIKNEKYHHL